MNSALAAGVPRRSRFVFAAGPLCLAVHTVACATVPARTDSENEEIAQFETANLAFEHGDSAAGFDGYMRLLQRAIDGKSGTASRRSLTSAAAARIGALLPELIMRRAAEERVLGLRREALPWAAQVALSEATGAIARRRGDPMLLANEARRSGCVGDAVLVGRVGRLPRLDLDAGETISPLESPVRIARSGCRLVVPNVDGLPGVWQMRVTVELPEGDYALVLGFGGMARVRVAGASWHGHGSTDKYGPRWTVRPVRLGGGAQSIEVRFSSFGSAADLDLLVLGAASLSDASWKAASDSFHPAGEVAQAIVAERLGDTDTALETAESLARHVRFAPGWLVAARIMAGDASRPANIGRAAARGLYRRAVDADARLARAWRELAGLDLEDDRTRDAAWEAEKALAAQPGWWPAQIALANALRARGLERDADASLEAAWTEVQTGDGACPVVEAVLRRAQERHQIDRQEMLAAALARCDAQEETTIEWHRSRGDLAGVQSALERKLAVVADPLSTRGELVAALVAQGKTAQARAELEALVAAAPRDVSARIRLADLHAAAGDRGTARLVIEEALRLFPTNAQARSAARALDLPLPTDAYRVDGRAVVRAFEKSGHRYDAPAVVVLDRAVARVFSDGAQMWLTHNIVRMQSKDAIDRWGEITIAEGSDVLTLRTIKADGTVREPEEIFGKATVSAPDLVPGDYVEWETLEARDPSEAFAPGFLGERFYFQSVEAPLDRSEFLVVVPEGLRIDVDRRDLTPALIREPAGAGLEILRFVAARVPQIFFERAAVPGIEWIPSVRVSSGVSMAAWSRFVADELAGVARASPALRRLAARIASETGNDRAKLPGAIAAWVAANIEPEAEILQPATSVLARGRGNRAALLVALARSLGVPAELVFARSAYTAAADAPVNIQELDDFREMLVLFPSTDAGARFVDPRLRHAPFGYLPPGLDGAPYFVLGQAHLARTRTAVADARVVSADVHLDENGKAHGTVTESLLGWPALEWAEMLDRAGNDSEKLRQDFEQRSLSQNFPGAALGRLAVEAPVRGGPTRVSYSFDQPELATREGDVLKLTPRFFRSQPARRYATEATRGTTLLLGYDVPLSLEMRVVLPPGGRLAEVGESAVVTAGTQGKVRFAERRQVQPASASAGQVLTIARQWRLPLLRVAPPKYAETAAQLRRIDPLEQAEVRATVPARSTTPPPSR